jgi:hypothetical protein
MDWTSTRIISLFLGLWMALAPAIFVVPATAMTLQMSVFGDANSGDCDCCRDGHANNIICMQACMNAFPFAAAAQYGSLVPMVMHNDHSAERDIVRSGHAFAPDPPPPRPVALR